MTIKKILIVCFDFFPINSPRSHRATELAKEFSKQGHRVTLLTPKKPEIHWAFEEKHNITIKDLRQPKWKSPNFGKSKVGYLMTRAAFRFLQLGFEYPTIELMFLVNKALKKESGYDLLISIAVPYPIHWGVAWARTKKHPIAKTWVADCGDPYIGCETDSFRKLFYFKYVEKWFMRRANYVSIPVETARNAYYSEFHEKIKVIPQGFNIEPIKEFSPGAKNNILTFGYAGGFIPEIRDPRPFLDFLHTIKDGFRFIIYTNKPELISKYQESLGEKLQIKGYIPREELLKVLAGMDFLVNFDNNTGTATPSKLIDYAIADRPVLNIEKNLHTDAIQQFLKGDYSQALNIGNIDQYRIDNVCHQFLALAANEE